MMRQVALKESFEVIMNEYTAEVLALLHFFLHMDKNCTCSQTCTCGTCLVHLYQMVTEAIMMTKLRHPNIVQFFGIWQYMENPRSDVKPWPICHTPYD